ncbi:MAG TPA: GatB/YqeY domain-containing protein [Gammaproteobacteria bacterium]|nr:GatB/YqeY domain-containing protein [Gammaproteobacteria bacterium]
MSLKDLLTQDMQAALKAGDKPRLSVLRMALAGVKQREVDTRRPLDDAGVQTVIERMIKQGRDSLAQFRDGGRQDLVAKEEAELAVLATYLPKPLDDSELDALIAEAIETSKASSTKDLGKVMAVIKTKAAGRVDMGAISARVRAMLTTE